MSLPSSKPAVSQQPSIRSFFSAKTPKYAPPPSQASSKPAAPAPAPAPLPPPPPASSTTTATAKSTPQPAQKSEPELRTDDEDDGDEDDDHDDEDEDNVQNGKDVEDDAGPTPSIPPLPASLPRESAIRPVSPRDLNALRRIHALLLPVAYPDTFYQHAVAGPFSRVITWAHDDGAAEPKVVGGVVCRLEPVTVTVTDAPSTTTTTTTPQDLYIQSLCLLSPYRGLGLVNAAVDNIVAAAVADPKLRVRRVQAHVWTENEGGLKWYEARAFTKRDERPIQGYYFKLRPSTAWLVSRDVGAAVRGSLPTSASASSRSIPSSTTAAVVNLPPMSGPPRSTRPPPSSRTPSGQSYQNQRAETEWNDLPEDIVSPGLRAPPPPRRKGASEPASGASSRSSSTARKKRDRSYPAAAFGKPPPSSS